MVLSISTCFAGSYGSVSGLGALGSMPPCDGSRSSDRISLELLCCNKVKDHSKFSLFLLIFLWVGVGSALWKQFAFSQCSSSMAA